MEEAAKIAFYAELDDLRNNDDDFSEDERQRRAVLRTFKQSSALKASRPGTSIPRRTMSAPSPGPQLGRAQTGKVIKGTPVHAQRPQDPAAHPSSPAMETSFVRDTQSQQPGLLRALGKPRRSATSPLPSTGNARPSPVTMAVPSPASVLSRKRKRSKLPDQLLPSKPQLFGGLSFYYIPNDDRNKVRKLRIAKARELGAEWVRDVGRASHVVVDRGLVWKDVQLVLGEASLQDVKLVSEDYPVDCGIFGKLLDVLQPKYRIPGQPASSSSASSRLDRPTTATNGDSSLVVSSPSLGEPERRPHRFDYNVPRGTPPRSEEASTGSGNADGKQVDRIEVRCSNDPVVPSSQIEAVGELDARRPAPDFTGSSLPVQDRQSPGMDDLDDCITEMQQFKDLPLDDDDDDDDAANDGGTEEHESESGEAGSSDGHAQESRRPDARRRTDRKNLTFEERFACSTGGTKDQAFADKNSNARTIEVLQLMCDYYAKVNDHWRTFAYRRALNVLKRQSTRISTEEEALRLPSIGQRLAKKIEEIATTDGLRRLEYAQGDASSIIFDRFYKIYGVGTNQANKWIAQGFRTLPDLVKGAKLNPSQFLGIEHYEDLNTRIPRAEVTALGDCVMSVARQIDADVELLVGGSYRRGADSSSDIDFIVTKKNTTFAADLVPFLTRLIDHLTDSGFIVATLASFSSVRRRDAKSSGSKWHGCCVLPQLAWEGVYPEMSRDSYRPIWRRIDFLLVPETEYGAALIYFTGNDIFNRSIRLLASKKGMRLNQRGLYKDVLRGPQRSKITLGRLLEGREERKIFEILGVKWRPPNERWC